MPLIDLTPLIMVERLAVASLIGVAVGTEREWSGPPEGPGRRFAGLRTFLLFGMLGGIAGVLLSGGATIPGSVLLAAGAALSIVAYARSPRGPGQPRDGTTEAAGLVVTGLGTLAGLGFLALSAGCAAVVDFALGEKERLHWLVSRIGREEMHAALQFLILALVILPLLPAGPFDQLWGFRPRVLWGMVLLLSGINFGGYIARRAVGPGRGYGVTGALAGLISSTALTLQFARISRAEPEHARGLALGVLAACTILPIRVFVVSLVLNPSVAVQLLYFVIPPFLASAAACALLLRHSASVEAPAEPPKNPLRLWTAVQLAVAFEVAFIVIDYARKAYGSSGLIGSSVVFGLADLDALTVTMNRLPGGSGAAVSAAHAIAIGLLTNTVSKLAIALVIGGREFRRLVLAGLATTAAALGGALWWRW